MDKIKILWIDDEADIVPAIKISPEQSFFEIEALHDLEKIAAYAVRGPSATNAAAPEFDIVATDFNLVSRSTNVATPDVALAVGLDSTAAGFLVGILLATAKPEQPRAVFPYSGDQTQFGAVWKAAYAFAPPWVTVAQRHDRSKLKGDPLDALKTMVESYRESLHRHLAIGSCAIDAETEKFLDRLEGGTNVEPISIYEPVTIKFGLTKRTFHLGALFYDRVSVQNGRQVMSKAQDVAQFFSSALGRSPEYKAALEKADVSWRRSNERQSLLCYKDGSGTENPNDRKWVLNHLPGGRDEGATIVAYTLIRSYVASKCLYDALFQTNESVDGDVPISALKEAVASRHSLDDKEFAFWSAYDELLGAFKDLDLAPATLDQLLDELDRHDFLKSWEKRFVRALDPLPQDFISSLKGGERVGKAVARIITRAADEKSQSPSAAMDLFRGQNTLSAEDLSVVRRFARQMIPAQFSWPEFLLTSANQATG